jgi:ABC-type uncharacterized transport system permease subunit
LPESHRLQSLLPVNSSLRWISSIKAIEMAASCFRRYACLAAAINMMKKSLSGFELSTIVSSPREESEAAKRLQN